ncbi:MAG: hypothetical protein LBQ50_02320 [Planctomycetaceae bacterium]|jgi:hypothetical protein|nr:hypothetical protein [Planctomycetaceae bacterium]
MKKILNLNVVAVLLTAVVTLIFVPKSSAQNFFFISKDFERISILEDAENSLNDIRVPGFGSARWTVKTKIINTELLCNLLCQGAELGKIEQFIDGLKQGEEPYFNESDVPAWARKYLVANPASPLQRAIHSKVELRVIKYLVDKGANVNEKKCPWDTVNFGSSYF